MQINFGDSLESQAVILLVRADGAGGFAMRPRERRESGKQDLFRSRLDQITSSYLVGISTGKSAGFAPLRMRATYCAPARR